MYYRIGEKREEVGWCLSDMKGNLAPKPSVNRSRAGSMSVNDLVEPRSVLLTLYGAHIRQ